MAVVKECWICGKKFSYCPNCKRKETWKKETCTTEHYQINLILDELREGVITKSEAKKRFENVGVNDNYDFSKLLPAVARDIKEILNTKRSVKYKSEKVKNI